MVLFAKKHKNGFSIDTMCTPGFDEHFIGKNPKESPESGKAILNLFRNTFISMLLIILGLIKTCLYQNS